MPSIENFATAVCIALCTATYGACVTMGADAPSWAQKMISLQYGNADNTTFGMGSDDLFNVAFIAAALTVLRKVLMEGVFNPMSAALGVEAEGGDAVKFRQQGWVMVYYTTAFLWGLQEIWLAPYWMDTAALWVGYPQNTAVSGSFKLYFVCQAAFWFHMVFVTLVEPWQNDFVVMIIHHFITIVMLLGSCYSGVLAVPHAILVEQDLADIFLPAAKMCNYVSAGGSSLAPYFKILADGLFGLFAVVWIPTRHVILPMIYYSILTEAEEGLLNGGCNCGEGSKLAYNPEMNCVLSLESWPQVLMVYKVALAIFQCLLLIWLRSILIAVSKALMGDDLTKIEMESDQSWQKGQDSATARPKTA